MTTDEGTTAQPDDPSGWADRCAAEMCASGKGYLEAIPGSQWWEHGTFVGYVCGHPFPPFNGVMSAAGPGDVADLDRALDRVVASGLPHLLRMRHGDAAVHMRLAERGYLLAETDPAMVLSSAAGLAVPSVDELAIEEVHGEAGLAEHLDVVCEAFGSPRDLTELVVGPELMADPSAHFYVGRLGGEAVTTAVGYRTGDSVGIYSVGTPDRLRGKGFGSAVTAYAVAAGVRDGASWAYLMSSEVGYGVYERLGFRTVGHWDLWVPPVADEARY